MNYHIQTLEQHKPILRGLRKHVRLTQADVASMLGITQQSYAKIEANPSGTSMERIFDILRLLGAGIILHQDDLPATKTFAKVQHPGASQVIDSPTIDGITKRLSTNQRDTATTLASETHFNKVNKNTETAPPKLLPPGGKKERW